MFQTFLRVVGVFSGPKRGYIFAVVRGFRCASVRGTAREEEGDLSFAEFGTPGDSGRLSASPTSDDGPPNENAPDLTSRGRSRKLERETGFEPATFTLAT